MKARILSDLHLELHRFEDDPIPEPQECDVVILAGDINTGVRGVAWAEEAFADSQVLYVLGNHEFYLNSFEAFPERVRKFAEGSNVRMLECESTVIGGVRFLGCTFWTDYLLDGLRARPQAMKFARGGMNDFRNIMLDDVKDTDSCVGPVEMALRCEQSRKWLETELKESAEPCVVITHHAPSLQSFDSRKCRALAPAYVSAMEDFILRYQPEMWIHGHTHVACDYKIGKTRVISNPKGYDQSVPGYDENLVVSL